MASGSGPASVRQEVMMMRVHELQQVSEKLGLRKTGRKGELQGRILSYFGELDPASSAAAALGRTSVHGPQQQWKLEQAAKVVHDVYRRMMGMPPVSATPASDQSAHSALHLPSSGGWPGLTPPLAAAHAQAQAHAAVAAALPPQQAYQQQHAQPPHGGQHGQQLSQQASQQQRGGYTPGRLAAGVAARLAGSAAAPPSGGTFMRSAPKNVRCICNVPGERGRMVQCGGRACGVWQHCECLGLRAPPDRFLCELCRARLADPFWEPTEQVLPPSRLKPMPGRPAVVTTGGVQEVQGAERVFYLHTQQLEPVQRDPGNHRLQAGCLLVGDEVACRYHWPKHVDLKVNSMPHRPYGRAPNAKMGINQRDDVAAIGSMVVRGRNSLFLSAADGGTWVLTLQLARRRTMDQVKALMAAPESLDAAVARVKRQVGGGGGGDDSDDDLLISHQVVSLKDPMSGQRMQVPARFTDASGLQAFDLDSLLSMAQRSRKWQDPTTLANSTIEQLQVDTYMQRVLACLKAAPGVSDVEISADGQWRPAEMPGCDWFDIAAEPASVAAAMGRAASASAGGGGSAAAEPAGAAGGGGGGAAAAGARAASELVVGDSESEEEDEAAELARAAAAVRNASSAALEALSGQKRKPAEPEVIDLLSSDDDEHAAQPPPQRPRTQQPAPQQPRQQPPQQQQQQQQQPAGFQPASQLRPGPAPPPILPAAAAAGQPLRIRLPTRGRPAAAPQAAQAVGSPLAGVAAFPGQQHAGFQPASQLAGGGAMPYGWPGQGGAMMPPATAAAAQAGSLPDWQLPDDALATFRVPRQAAALQQQQQQQQQAAAAQAPPAAAPAAAVAAAPAAAAPANGLPDLPDLFGDEAQRYLQSLFDDGDV